MNKPPVLQHTVVMICPHVKYEDGLLHAPFEVHQLWESRPVDGLDKEGNTVWYDSDTYVCCEDCTWAYSPEEFPVAVIGVWMGRFPDN